MLSTFAKSDHSSCSSPRTARVDAELVYLSINLALSQVVEIVVVEQRARPLGPTGRIALEQRVEPAEELVSRSCEREVSGRKKTVFRSSKAGYKPSLLLSIAEPWSWSTDSASSTRTLTRAINAAFLSILGWLVG